LSFNSQTNQILQHGNATKTNQTSADNQELIVFIDPLDGTREYIENRIHNVQCLIGITLNGVPIAGAVGLPFGSGSNTSDNNNNNKRDEDLIEVAYGWIMPQNCREVDVDTINNSAYHMIASGIKHFDAKNKMPTDSTITTATSDNNGLLSNLNDNDEEDDTLIILSGDSQKPALQITMDCLENDVLRNSASSTAAASVDKEMDSTSATSFPYRKIICGGCGNKILYLGRRHQLIFKRKKLKRKLQQESGSETTSDEPISIVGTIAISPPGSSSWDTAAPSAVLLSLDPNALVTDLIGRPLVYNGVDLTNVHGVVVSSGDGAVKVHRELCDRLSRNEAFCSVIGVDNR
jgi:3'-phosphoadenosine 5'-phosphosulfate (PAPS) 3'-phosphatase